MLVNIPELDANFQPLVWCPMMIKMKEQRKFLYNDPQHLGDGAILEALNDPNFRGSLKEAYGGKSM